MKFGFCTNLRYLQGDTSILDAIQTAGFDFVELPLRDITTLSEDDFSRLLDIKIPCLVCNVFFPNMPLVGPNRNEKEIHAHIEKALDRASRLGVKKIVLGSGAARTSPKDYDITDAMNDLRVLLEYLNNIAEKHDIIICLEPLNRKETNTIIIYETAVAMAYDLDNIKITFDLYHAIIESRPCTDILLAPEKLGHLHIAYSEERLVPALTDIRTAYNRFAKAVKQSGYNETISIEGQLKSSDIQKEISESLIVLKELFTTKA